jgi:HTH-type transcriptional regulator / antitoxin HipB
MKEFKVETVEQLASHLRSLRRASRLTQAQLGSRLGVEQARIAKIESSPGSISAEQLLTILKALNAVFLIQKRDAARSTRPRVNVEW